MWIRILTSLDPELESESQNGHKSDSGARSRAGIITPLLPRLFGGLPWHLRPPELTDVVIMQMDTRIVEVTYFRPYVKFDLRSY